MSQKLLIYAFIARGNVVLAEYTEFSGNFNSIAYQCLQKLPASNNKFTYNCDAHTFNYLVDNGYSYVLLSLLHLSFSFDLWACYEKFGRFRWGSRGSRVIYSSGFNFRYFKQHFYASRLVYLFTLL